jgi:hypothetical protein
VLRGLDIDEVGSTCSLCGAPINFSGRGTLKIESVQMRGYSRQSGIDFHPSGAAKLFVYDTSIINMGSLGPFSGVGSLAGINIKPASGVTASITIERTRIDSNSFGIIADGTSGGLIRGVVSDSVVSGNINNGITVAASGAGAAVLSVQSTTVSGNNFGLAASGANSGMLVTQSSIMLNNTGLFTTNGGVLLTYKDNKVNGNITTDGAFTGPVGQQ